MVSLGPSPSGEDIIHVTISTCPEEGSPKVAGGTKTDTGIVIYSNLASSGSRTVSDKIESIRVDQPLAEEHCASYTVSPLPVFRTAISKEAKFPGREEKSSNPLASI